MYRFAGFVYLMIRTPDSERLFNADGLLYCTNAINFDCQSFYTVDELITTWNCGDTFQESQISSFSKVNPSSKPPSINQSISLYPNPNQGRFSIVLNGFEEEAINLQILNLQGSIIKSYRDISPQQVPFQVTLDEVENGLYYIRAVVNGTVISKKVMVTN